ncbi:MAG: bifunctional folylpolyglutamate synthase/dihydrofolate synthase [Deltaproteobacteria bacterium]|nr:bifunctional folylpolyglutamate synthase/dihydrofolate synthase [Deltaproteobacteria bacterium]
MQYQEAWSYLDQLQFFKIKLGLDSMAGFLDGVNHPQRDLKFIHVAGTNGKGSVSVTLLTLLGEAGYKAGLYTSPHLCSVRERFRINDRYISKDDFAGIATMIRNGLGERQITYFEFTTALALLWFAQEKVDIVILETGLGGRLDATNVISPLVSVITNVSMDHEAHLGTTLEQIAAEKAGIIKQDIPVVSGVAADGGLTVVSRACQEKNAPLFLLGRDFTAQRHGDGSWDYAGVNGLRLHDLPLRMKGDHQLDNAALALAVLDCLRPHGFMVNEQSVAQGLAGVRWPGRLEYFCIDRDTGRIMEDFDQDHSTENNNVRRYLLDGAHNPAGISSLIRSLKSDFAYGRLICVWASMSDKDIAKTLNPIAPYCQIIIFTRPESERSATPEKLTEILPDELKKRAVSRVDVSEAVRYAEKEAGPRDLICIAGSLYLVGAARKILLGDIVEGD